MHAPPRRACRTASAYIEPIGLRCRYLGWAIADFLRAPLFQTMRRASLLRNLGCYRKYIRNMTNSGQILLMWLMMEEALAGYPRRQHRGRAPYALGWFYYVRTRPAALPLPRAQNQLLCARATAPISTAAAIRVVTCSGVPET